jgi:hypothetical protein
VAAGADEFGVAVHLGDGSVFDVQDKEDARKMVKFKTSNICYNGPQFEIYLCENLL